MRILRGLLLKVRIANVNFNDKNLFPTVLVLRLQL